MIYLKLQKKLSVTTHKDKSDTLNSDYECENGLDFCFSLLYIIM